MMERKFIKGENVEDCLDSIDLILQHWAPKLGNYITGIISPVPILAHTRFADSDGVIFAGILPFTGKISRAFLSIGKYNVRPLQVIMTMLSEITHSGARIQADKPIISYQSDILVNAGDIMKVEILPANGGEEFLIGLLCHPDVSYGERETRLVSELKLLESFKEV